MNRTAKRFAFVHIGFHKTGTTFLQRQFEHNREWLRTHGLVFPETGIVNPENPSKDFATRGHAQLRTLFMSPDSLAAQSLRLRLFSELDKAGDLAVLISSETFSTLDNAPAVAAGLATLLRDQFVVRIIVYLRRQDYWLDSFYREVLGWVGRRETGDIDDFYRREGQAWLDYERRLSNWVDTFGPENVIVRDYDRVAENGGIFRDFLQAANVYASPPAESTYEPRLNLSMPRRYVDLVRAVNTIDYMTAKEKRAFIRNLQNSSADAIRDSGGTLISDSLWTELRNRFNDSNRSLCDRFFPGRQTSLVFPERREPTVKDAQAIEFDTCRRLIDIIYVPSKTTSPNSDLDTFGVTAIMREPLTQTQAFINYHLNIGADAVLIFLDDPSDPIVDRYVHPRVTFVRCSDEFWKSELGSVPSTMGEKIRHCRKVGHERLSSLGVDWIVPLDGDELLYSTASVRAFLTSLKKEVSMVAARSLEAVQHEGMAPSRAFEARYFKTQRNTRSRLGEAAEWLLFWRLRRYVRIGFEPNVKSWVSGYFGHVEGRWIYRSSISIKAYRSHNVSPDTPAKRLDTDTLHVLHFESASFDEWYVRWRRRITGETVAVDIGPIRKAQETAIREAIKAGREAAMRLYRTWHWWGRAAILIGQKCGILSRVDIPDFYFGHLPSCEPIRNRRTGRNENKRRKARRAEARRVRTSDLAP